MADKAPTPPSREGIGTAAKRLLKQVDQTYPHGIHPALVPGIGAIIAFILTENMRNPMVFTDRWTLLMVIIALVQLVLVLFGAKKEKEPAAEQADETPKPE